MEHHGTPGQDMQGMGRGGLWGGRTRFWSQTYVVWPWTRKKLLEESTAIAGPVEGLKVAAAEGCEEATTLGLGWSGG